MKRLPHIVGIAIFVYSVWWINDILRDFGVAYKINDNNFILLATGWGAIVAAWPVALAGAIISGFIAYFVGLFLGEAWTTRDLHQQVKEVIEQAESERILLKSQSRSLQGRQEEVKQEIQAEKFKICKRLQKIKEREKTIEEREKHLETLGHQLDVERVKNEKLMEMLTKQQTFSTPEKK